MQATLIKNRRALLLSQYFNRKNKFVFASDIHKMPEQKVIRLGLGNLRDTKRRDFGYFNSNPLH